MHASSCSLRSGGPGAPKTPSRDAARGGSRSGEFPCLPGLRSTASVKASPLSFQNTLPTGNPSAFEGRSRATETRKAFPFASFCFLLFPLVAPKRGLSMHYGARERQKEILSRFLRTKARLFSRIQKASARPRRAENLHAAFSPRAPTLCSIPVSMPASQRAPSAMGASNSEHSMNIDGREDNVWIVCALTTDSGAGAKIASSLRAIILDLQYDPGTWHRYQTGTVLFRPGRPFGEWAPIFVEGRRCAASGLCTRFVHLRKIDIMYSVDDTLTKTFDCTGAGHQ